MRFLVGLLALAALLAGCSAIDAESDGLVRLSAEGSAREVVDRLVGSIEANPNLRLVAVVDHRANAARVELELEPALLVIFGNPALGTPLIASSPDVGIDLPQRVLVVERSGRTEIIYNDPAVLVERRGGDVSLEEITTIAGALEVLADSSSNAR